MGHAERYFSVSELPLEHYWQSSVALNTHNNDMISFYVDNQSRLFKSVGGDG